LLTEIAKIFRNKFLQFFFFIEDIPMG